MRRRRKKLPNKNSRRASHGGPLNQRHVQDQYCRDGGSKHHQLQLSSKRVPATTEQYQAERSDQSQYHQERPATDASKQAKPAKDLSL